MDKEILDEPAIDITIRGQEPEEENLERLVEERMEEDEKEIVLDIEEDDEDSRVFRRHTNAGAGTTHTTALPPVTLETIQNNGKHLVHSLKRWIQSGMDMFDSVFMRVVAVLLCLALVVLLVLAIPRAVGVIEAGVQSILPSFPEPTLPSVAPSTVTSPPQMNLMSMMLPLVVSHFILPKLF